VFSFQDVPVEGYPPPGGKLCSWAVEPPSGDETAAIGLNPRDAIAYNLHAWAHLESGKTAEEQM